jgi:hypothetical protein
MVFTSSDSWLGREVQKLHLGVRGLFTLGQLLEGSWRAQPRRIAHTVKPSCPVVEAFENEENAF